MGHEAALDAIVRSYRETRDGAAPPRLPEPFDFLLIGGKTYSRYWPTRLDAMPGQHGQTFKIEVENGYAVYEFSENFDCWRLTEGFSGTYPKGGLA